MFKTISRFLQHDTVEICYCNVDSIHISIDRSEVKKFLTSISDIIGDDAGQLKVEAIADEGYWFDIGRYWLIKGRGVIAFKNASIHHKGSRSIFTRSRNVSKTIKSEYFTYVKEFYISIYNCFSFKKIIQRNSEDNVVFKRFSASQVSDYNVALNASNQEIVSSKGIKIDLFRNISRRFS